ncbi:MAG: ABC transporter ATP-binding protein/permease, partial [Pseudorhodoplanes sp.]|nr:ABC transporter ATP-binding protein/permease [Pseudorhodoplanes sp.]
MTGSRPTFADIWRLAAPYFRSEDRWAGRGLLIAVILIELAVVGLTVLVNQWNNTFYNALQDRNWDIFVDQLLYFCGLASGYIVLRVYQLYLNQWLQIRWRRWMTEAYVGHWLQGSRHYRMQLQGDAADNPDQRIAEDIQLFIARALRIGLGLLNAIVTLFSFVIILWGLSNAAPLQLFGVTWGIPGYLVWAALIYSVFGTLVTHLIGRPLIRLLFEQQRYEADFRFNLVRVRENSEQIALLGGEAAEAERLSGRFGHVVKNWLGIMSRQKKLTFFTAGYDQASVVFPYIMVAPAYFAGQVQLGALMQTASAFGSVQGAMSFFVTAYSELAEFGAVIRRLAGFDAAIAHATTAEGPTVEVKREAKRSRIDLQDLALRLPDGSPLLSRIQSSLKSGEHVLLTGPSGSGKSTLFRALAGVWPFGSGTVALPDKASLMILPQRPYFPVATLAAAIAYPGLSGSFSREQLAGALTAVGLPTLIDRLYEENHWNRILSPGEQQRLAIARPLLQAPDFL